MKKIQFQDVTLKIIDKNGALWLTTKDIAQALYACKGYPQSDTPLEKRVLKLFSRHSEEFTNKMTSLIEVETNGGIQQIRVFSLRGAHLLGMLARTERAKEFRRWVLDIIECHDNEVGILTTEYHQILANYSANKARASICGKLLNLWKRDKKNIELRLDALCQKIQPDMFLPAT